MSSISIGLSSLDASPPKKMRLEDASTREPTKAQSVPAIPRSVDTTAFVSPPLRTTRAEIMQALERDGYCVVPDVLSSEQCDAVADALWTYMETLSPAISRADLGTFNCHNRPIHARGLIQHYNVGFQEFSVAVRVWVARVFAELYGTDELWSSVDGASFTIKPKTCHYADMADWVKNHWARDPVHVDQTTPGFSCVQGGVAISEQAVDEHVFLCVPGSHKLHEKLLEMGPAKKTLHWEMMGDAQKEYMRARGLDMRRVPLARGSMVLWDSRVVHSSSPYFKTADPTAMRMQVFACMLPIDRVPLEKRAAQIEKRKRAYERGAAGKHSPDYFRPFGTTPQTRGRDQGHLRVPKSVEMTDPEKRLHALM